MFEIGDWTSKAFPCEIIRKIPGGNMAQLFLARLQHTEQLFVVKGVEAAKGKFTTAEILTREASILKQLYHKNIPAYFSYFEEPDKRYFIMSYHEGIHLAQYVKQQYTLEGERISERFVQHIVLELCNLLAYLHQKGIVHRDIKPSNILLKPNKEIVLLDFGTAEYVKKEDPKPLFYGTMGYAAPECWHREGKTVTHQTDIFALGVLMYFLLEGKEPKEHFGRFVLSDEQKKNRWQSVLNKCCALHMHNRYESVAKVFDVVKKILS